VAITNPARWDFNPNITEISSGQIAQQMALAFNIQIDKDVVRRILAHHSTISSDWRRRQNFLTRS
jgi:hypothetical protein